MMATLKLAGMRAASGKSTTAIAANCVRNGGRARFFNTVDLVNQLEAEARMGRAGKLAAELLRSDLIVPLTSSAICRSRWSCGQMLFHLVSQLYERTSIVVNVLKLGLTPTTATTNPVADFSGMIDDVITTGSEAVYWIMGPAVARRLD